MTDYKLGAAARSEVVAHSHALPLPVACGRLGESRCGAAF